MPQLGQSLQSRKNELEKERDRIRAILERRAKKDPKVKGNYITNFPDTDTETEEVEDEVFEDTVYEADLDIEHVLENRLSKIEEELRQINKELKEQDSDSN